VTDVSLTPRSTSLTEPPSSPEDLWTCTKDGFGFMESTLKKYPLQLAHGNEPPPFIHRQHFDTASRPAALTVATSLAQMDISMTSQSKSLFLDLVDSKIHQIQIQVCHINTHP
jgi:hypothetical protein